MATDRSHLRSVSSSPEAEVDDRIPPHDEHAEVAVISAATLNPVSLSAVADLLLPEHFYSGAHRWVFDAILDLHREKKPVDVVAIGSWLRARKKLSNVGGMPALTEMVDGAPVIAPAHARAYAETVFDLWRVRQTIALGQKFSAIGYCGVPEVQKYVDDALMSVATIARQQPNAPQERVVDTLKRLVHAMQQASSTAASPASRRPGLLTGVGPFDAVTGGLRAAQKFTVVALPGRGKTAFGLFAAMTAAAAGIGVVYFSGEMTRDELAERQLALLTNIDSRRIRKSKVEPSLTNEEWSRVFGALEASAKLPLVIDDSHSLTIDDVCARTKRQAQQMPMVDKVPLGLVVLDYVQRLRAPSGFERRKKFEIVDHSTERFKMLCQELKIAGLELAQQKSPDKGKAPPKPMLGMVADTSLGVEKEADAVLYLHRKEPKNQRDLLGVLVKQRGGGECEFDLTLEPETGRFSDPHFEAASRDFVEAPTAARTQEMFNRFADDGDDAIDGSYP